MGSQESRVARFRKSKMRPAPSIYRERLGKAMWEMSLLNHFLLEICFPHLAGKGIAEVADELRSRMGRKTTRTSTI